MGWQILFWRVVQLWAVQIAYLHFNVFKWKSLIYLHDRSTFTLLWFSFVFLFNGCAPSGGSNSSSPDYEGTWVAQCKESEDISGLYIRNIFSLSGTKYNDETLTYSDAECAQRSSGLYFPANVTFTTETGGVVDGE